MPDVPVPESGTPAPRDTSAPEARGRRRAEFDGLRGVAIILVVLSHGWLLWIEESAALAERRFLGPWFEAGNLAVSIFFVVGAFLATRGMVTARDSARGLRPATLFIRRFIRLSGQVVVLLAAVLVVTALDDSDTYAGTDTGTSVFRILTYTWNWYLESSPLAARPDLGNLWYLSVDMQVFVLVLGLVWLLRRSPRVLPLVLAGLLVASVSWKVHTLDVEGTFSALLRTTTRMDAPLTGALVASLLPLLVAYRRFGPVLAVGGVVALVPLVYLNADAEDFLGLPGQLLNAALAAFVLGVALAPTPRVLRALLGVRPLAFLGRHSLSIFIWHYPLFFFLSRHTGDWSWPVRTVVGIALLLATSLLAERLVETRVQRILEADVWHHGDTGVRRVASAGWSAARTRVGAPRHRDGG